MDAVAVIPTETEVEVTTHNCTNCSAEIVTPANVDGHEVAEAAFIFCDDNCLSTYEKANNVSFN